jgi:phosphatidylserine/phosphatidylglycerophosphate/cardiolipin synthase-like enzyme
LPGYPGLIGFVVVLSGCASVGIDLPKTVNTAPADTGETFLGERVEEVAEEHPGEAGFYPTVNGIDAPAVGLLMAERAEQAERATLHTKAFAVDRRHLFIGSFNFDPRSAHVNTELGVIIDSAELTGPMVDRFQELTPTETYEVILNEEDQLRWLGIENGQENILDKEPQTTW